MSIRFVSSTIAAVIIAVSAAAPVRAQGIYGQQSQEPFWLRQQAQQQTSGGWQQYSPAYTMQHYADPQPQPRQQLCRIINGYMICQ